ncbi:MAG: hypothetical protein H8E66_08465 [Planctomycetes bacterium]|nr:hypothetical protein [Planctomycetota bacterium]
MNLPRRYRWRLIALLVVLCGGWLPVAATANADEPESLSLVPANAAFYSAATHLREQYDAFISSRAAAKLREMPIVQMGLGLAQAKWNDRDGDFASLKSLLEQPENKRLVELAVDAVSNEVFIYGDEGFADLLGLMKEISQANRAAMREFGEAADGAPADQIAAKMSQIFAEHLDKARVPDTVIGFRLSDTELALSQLNRLEQVLGELLADQPELKQRLSRKQIAGGEFLTMQLDGSLIPWDEFTQGAEIDLSEIRAKFNKMKASVAVGVKGQYLLVSLGDNNDHLALLGQGEVLANRKELAPLKQRAQRQICAVSYASGEFMKHASSSEQRLDQLVTMAESFLPISGIEASLQNQILGDVRGLVADIKTMIPEPGAVSSFVFKSDRGYEGFAHNWGENKVLDASKPLTVLEHVGGDPILAVAGRGNYSPDRYDAIAKWIGRAIYYGETFGIAYLGAKEREFYGEVRDDLAVLVKKLDQVTREKVVPAFRDGQVAVVLDAKITSKQWHEILAPTDEPLPMLELGLVCGVSDAQLVKEAATDYFQIAQEVINTLHKAEPATIPDFQLPPPGVREFPDGTVYYYRLPREAGLDKQIAPNAGLSQDTLVLSLTPKTTVRLLAKTPLSKADLIGKHQGAAGAAFRFSFARLIGAVAPWVDYGVELSGEEVDEEMLVQVHTGLEVASCLRDISAVTFQEDGAWVTHFELHFEDLAD